MRLKIFPIETADCLVSSPEIWILDVNDDFGSTAVISLLAVRLGSDNSNCCQVIEPSVITLSQSFATLCAWLLKRRPSGRYEESTDI